MKKQNFKSRSRYLTREQAATIIDFLNGEELYEHDSVFKIYRNGKFIGSANSPIPVNNNKIKKDENIDNTSN